MKRTGNPVLAILTLFLSIGLFAEGPDKQLTKVKEVINEHFSYYASGKMLFVDVNSQEMYVMNKSEIIQTFEISSSKYGEGEVPNSMKTPLGLHFIAKKVGEGADINTIFKSRVNTKRKAVPNDERFKDKDLITTRIMWLEGGEERNSLGAKSSMRRYIYIHGTPDEELLGQPASHGCIRMRNIDVYALYEFVEEGTPVIIWKDGYLKPDVIADLPELKTELSKKEKRKAERLKKKEEKRSLLRP
ncbi:MAG: L,D-transpeptidase [Flavobacteriales bacterium]|nr:L,D-transpeptidase [Flavobacteriales bacterium]